MAHRNGSRRAGSKEIRKLVTAIRARGGTVTVTARGHLRVEGPQGVTIIGPDPPSYGCGRRNVMSALKRHTGLNLGR